MKVLFFAQSRQAAGCGETSLEVAQPIDSTEFWNRLEQKFTDLKPLRRTARLARADEYLSPGDLLHPGDEIAVIPPVSGG